MLHQFPAEIALHTLSYLALHSLCSAMLVSRDWNALIATNEPAVYRTAAILHRFIDIDRPTGGADAITTDWKAYCRRQLEIERGWRGKAPSIVQELTATGPSVRRIKVDCEFGLVITTCQMGGLLVCDVESNRILWALHSSHAPNYVHVEYDRGYIIFNRFDSCKEVWRRTIDAPDELHSEVSPPDKTMLDTSAEVATRFDSPSRRGHFRAWALLRMPEVCRWLRLSYPNLLAVALKNAYVWDVTRSRQASVIQNIQRHFNGSRLGTATYAEVDDRYAFICSGGRLRIFARDDGVLLYQLHANELSRETWDVRPSQTRDLVSSVVHPQLLRKSDHSSRPFCGVFMACHVSASGDDLAVLTVDGRLVLLPGFQRLFARSEVVAPRDIIIILNFQQSDRDDISRYLAVGGRNGRWGVATQNGIYLVSLDVDSFRVPIAGTSSPELGDGVSVCRLSTFDNERLLALVSCLQITHDAVYFTYKPSERDSFSGARTVYRVGF